MIRYWEPVHRIVVILEQWRSSADAAAGKKVAATVTARGSLQPRRTQTNLFQNDHARGSLRHSVGGKQFRVYDQSFTILVSSFPLQLNLASLPLPLTANGASASVVDS